MGVVVNVSTEEPIIRSTRRTHIFAARSTPSIVTRKKPTRSRTCSPCVMNRLMTTVKRIGVPAHEIAMMMTIALRFIPTLLDETDKIMKAQQARGADFDTGNLIQKAKSLIPILVPLFISAFRRAEELAMAMEARCYHGDEHRTRMNVMTMKSSDYRAAVMAAVYTVVIIGLRFVAKAVPFII